jgi:MFS transporter, DHA2 family, multidrug resistance protein
VTTSVQNELTKSFDGAESVAQQYPQYATQITAGAKAAFLQGDQWAYVAGIVAVLLGALVVAAWFPRFEREKALLASYRAEDAEGASTADVPAASPQPSAI